jgi:hypothetical protein
MSEEMNMHRRQVIGGLGATIAAAAVTPVFGAGAKISSGKKGEGLVDPLTKYPKPPFPSQTQPWPGLLSKMDPRPDHGEKSYKGSGQLAGRKALITGGDSGMGRAAAIAYAREGADVAINYFPSEESDAQEVIALIKAEGRKGIAIPGDLRDEAFCQKLVDQAVQALGSGSYMDTPSGEWRCYAGKARKIRRRHTIGKAGTTCGTRVHLCAACIEYRKLRYRTDLWFVRWKGTTIK